MDHTKFCASKTIIVKRMIMNFLYNKLLVLLYVVSFIHSTVHVYRNLRAIVNIAFNKKKGRICYSIRTIKQLRDFAAVARKCIFRGR